MNQERFYLIADLEGYTPQVSRLISMLNYARFTTLASVRNLTMEQLDHLHDKESNSIGALPDHSHC